MALTPEKREALKLARELIKTGKEYFICNALLAVARMHPNLSATCYEIRKFISNAIWPKATLGEWQRLHGIPDRSDAQRRADRIAWFDWMLDEPQEA
jgi:hypothetical protein